VGHKGVKEGRNWDDQYAKQLRNGHGMRSQCGPNNPGPWHSLTTMSQSASTSSASATHFESIFNAALDAYRRQTKQDLVSNSLLPTLQSCDSPDAIINLLRDQIPAFSQSQTSDDRVSKWLIPTVNVLYSFSAALGEGVGLVYTTVSFSRTSVLMSVSQVFSPAKVIFAGIGMLFLVCIFHVSLSQTILTFKSFRPPKM
jgi:hypothetical protein